MRKKLLSLGIVSCLLLAGLTGCNSSSNGSSNGSSLSDSNKPTDTTNDNSSKEPDKEADQIMYEIDPNKPIIALTFDDGPNSTTTMRVLDKCEEYQVVASFFVVGNNINDKTAEVVKRAYDMGCEIDNHSKTHGYLNKMTAEEIIDEVQFTSDKVKEITGESTKFFRPPYIATNSLMYESVDMPFICGIGSNDWDNKVTVEQRSEKILEQVKDGAIILLHDSEGNLKTVEALDTLIPELKEQGYQFATVSQLFEAKGIAIDSQDTNLYSFVQ